ncbi:hypothetical protein GCM10023189_36320 [Nibrella saemangeumensis]|uniref:Uncharacterized protein n=1 Tax=Nibrella saemangeumensis TaxID=1084526 RepID=A0ABP8N471_9BACT
MENLALTDPELIYFQPLNETTTPIEASAIATDPPLGNQIGNTTSQVYPRPTNIWVPYTQSPHQLYVRVEGGRLAAPNYWQLLLINQLNAAPPPAGQSFPGTRLDQFGGSWATETPWRAYPARYSPYSYYFGGRYHQDGQWRWNYGGLIVEKTYYRYGVLQRVNYENGHNNGYDDYIIQLAFIWL